MIIHNTIEVSVPDADYSSGILLLDYPAMNGGRVTIKSNKVKHNDLRESILDLNFKPEGVEAFNEIK